MIISSLQQLAQFAWWQVTEAVSAKTVSDDVTTFAVTQTTLDACAVYHSTDGLSIPDNAALIIS